MQVSCLVLPDGHVSTSLPWSPFSHALVLGCPILGAAWLRCTWLSAFYLAALGKASCGDLGCPCELHLSLRQMQGKMPCALSWLPPKFYPKGH